MQILGTGTGKIMPSETDVAPKAKWIGLGLGRKPLGYAKSTFGAKLMDENLTKISNYFCLKKNGL